MATGTVLNQFIVVKKTLTNVACNGITTNNGVTLQGSYIDVTSNIPSGYIPIISALKGTSTASTNELVQCIPVGASWRSIDSTWIMRLLNHNNVTKTVNGTLYILCVKDPT